MDRSNKQLLQHILFVSETKFIDAWRPHSCQMALYLHHVLLSRTWLSRPRPKTWLRGEGQGQGLDAAAEAKAMATVFKAKAMVCEWMKFIDHVISMSCKCNKSFFKFTLCTSEEWQSIIRVWNLTFIMAYSASMKVAGMKIKYVLRELNTEL